jgi:hypothetical protein
VRVKAESKTVSDAEAAAEAEIGPETNAAGAAKNNRKKTKGTRTLKLFIMV